MSMTAASMRDFIKAHMSAAQVPQTTDTAVAQNYGDAMLLALCQGIIDEITTNGRAVNIIPGSGQSPIE